MSWVQYVRLRTYACFQLCMPLVSGCVNCALINAVPKRVSCYTDVNCYVNCSLSTSSNVGQRSIFLRHRKFPPQICDFVATATDGTM